MTSQSRINYLLLATMAITLLGAFNCAAAETERVSLDSAGNEGNAESRTSFSSISADGRYVVFCSIASNLVAGDTNGAYDVFVHDRINRITTRVSVSSEGVQGDNHSTSFSISADGRFIAFGSDASNLVLGETNVSSAIYVHDLITSATSRVSDSTLSARSPSISADGRYVAFEQWVPLSIYSGASPAIFVHDRNTGINTRISGGSDQLWCATYCRSEAPSISADGRYIAFQSEAYDLVVDDRNSAWDIFVHDRGTGITSRVSVDSTGREAYRRSFNPSISADGRFVAFASEAPNLVDGDTNVAYDVFVHDRVSGVTSRVSVSSTGNEVLREGAQGANYPSISADGRFVVFAWDPVWNNYIYVHDRAAGNLLGFNSRDASSLHSFRKLGSRFRNSATHLSMGAPRSFS